MCSQPSITKMDRTPPLVESDYALQSHSGSWKIHLLDSYTGVHYSWAPVLACGDAKRENLITIKLFWNMCPKPFHGQNIKGKFIKAPRVRLSMQCVASHPLLNHSMVSHPMISYPIVSHPIVSYPIVSHPIVSHPIVSHLFIYLFI